MQDFDIQKDFWQVHPQFKHINPFKKFYATNPRKDSSKLMWFLKYIYHLDSEFFNMDELEKIDLVGESILEEKNFYHFNQEHIDELAKVYKKIVDTPVERSIRMIKTTLDKKNKFLEDTEYSWDSFEDIDKATLSYDKQIMMLEKLISIRDKEKEKGGKARGDAELSLADRGEI